MQRIKAVWLSALLAMAHAGLPGQARAGLSDQSSAVSFVSVLIPLSIVHGVSKGASGVVENSFKAISGAISGEATWTVTELTPVGEKTRATLYCEDRKTTLVLDIPTQQVKETGLRTGQTVVSRSEGTRSFSFRYEGQTLGVLVDEAAMSHSRKLN